MIHVPQLIYLVLNQFFGVPPINFGNENIKFGATTISFGGALNGCLIIRAGRMARLIRRG
jgi:hypothetical protein